MPTPNKKPKCRTCNDEREICSACRLPLMKCRCNPNAHDAEDLPPGMQCPDCELGSRERGEG